MVEENTELTAMYVAIVESFNYKVIHYLNYEDLYKNLDGEGFTAVIVDGRSVESSLEFISKVRKNAPIQIPIFVLLDNDTEEDQFLNYGNVNCISKFPDSGSLISELTKKLSPHRQFKGLLHNN